VPRVIILAGPNGAGKTTFAKEFLPNEAACVQFVNADLIAAGLSPFAPETADIAAGRAMLRRLDELVSLREDFALETTLSGKWLLHRVRQWWGVGYKVELYYLRLDSPEIALSRIANRVKSGGHNVPEPIVRRRYVRGAQMLDQYKEAANQWMIYNNSDSKPTLESLGF